MINWFIKKANENWYMTQNSGNYIGNCTHLDAELVSDMIDNDIGEISLKEFEKYVNKEDFAQVKQSLGYDENFPIKKDWHVKYHKSFYEDKPSVYMVQSAIEYVFI